MHTVLITGASRGFGRALFEVYARRGWRTFPLVRDSSVAKQLRTEAGPECHPIVGDVSSIDTEEQIARVLERQPEALDVLINNAGHIKKHRGLQNTTVEDLLELFGVHCIGAFRCTRGALPFLMRSDRAVVVNISSRWGSIGRTVLGKGGGIYSYQIAKCAQNMLTASLDQELREAGVRVMAVHPGRLKTEAAAPDADTEPQEAARALVDWIDRVDQHTAFGFYDLMGDRTLEW
ncbi:MAG TPA: SDR family NAD(P)-dependent oxidoreductase [Anaerolineae bacterium]|nr:SDR family NAD(P)-dependent oxidoreductase [Anaerolineae bacterium]